MNTALMAKIDILLNLINFTNDMLNESMPPDNKLQPNEALFKQ